MSLGDNIRIMRRARDFSQQQLADILGYKSDVTIQHWETGRNEPNVGALQKMCALFGVSFSDMCTLDLSEEWIKDAVLKRGDIISMIEEIPAGDLDVMYDIVLGYLRGIRTRRERTDAESGKAKIGKIPNQGSEDIERTQD